MSIPLFHCRSNAHLMMNWTITGHQNVLLEKARLVQPMGINFACICTFYGKKSELTSYNILKTNDCCICVLSALTLTLLGTM